MKNKLQKILPTVLAVLFLLTLWEISARLVDLHSFFPTATETFAALLRLVSTARFWERIVFSVLRVLIGFAIGCAAGCFFAVVAEALPFSRPVFRIAATVLRSAPVASFIIILWALIGSDAAPSAIAAMMVLPIVYQNTEEGFSSIDKDLDEVTKVFRLSKVTRFRVLVLPTVLSYLAPALVTSVGLAWKAGIAAEIISYTKASIGREIYDAKGSYEGAELFAWTLSVILLCLLFEALVRFLPKGEKRRV